jgi:hypothetical protein
MKASCIAISMVFLVACGAMGAPEEEISDNVPGAAILVEAMGESPSYETLGTALSDEPVDAGVGPVVQCGLGCPGTTHPTAYLCSGTCGSVVCPSYQNAALCAANAEMFSTCGLGCPPGWYPNGYTMIDSCKINPFAENRWDNATFCNPIEGDLLSTCGSTCPTGYVEISRNHDANCDPYDSIGFTPNRTNCRRPLLSPSLSVSPSSVSETNIARGTVTLNYPAPVQGVVVALSSSNSSLARVPATLNVPEGVRTMTFSIRTSHVSQDRTVSITATVQGNSDSAPLTITDIPETSTTALAPPILIGGGMAKGTVRLTAPARAGGTVVTLFSSDPRVAWPARPSVRVPAGATTASFDVWTRAASIAKEVTIYASSGEITRSATLTVLAGANPNPGSGADHPAPGCQGNRLTRNDDRSTGAVALPFLVNFFGRTYTHVYVNNNGNVTFERPLSAYTPFHLNASTPPIIAPFLADVDTRGFGSGVVSYGTDQFSGRPAFCVEWKDVGYFNSHTDKLNSFQLLLVDRSDEGTGDFDIVMNYDRLHWEAGDASGGRNGLGGTSAGAGYSAGTGQVDAFFQFPGSLVNGAFLDGNDSTGLARTSRNSLQRGRHVFEVRNGAAPTGGTIAGDVTTYGGLPLANAPVEVCPAAGGRCVFFTRTGAQGRYLATGLPAGEYRVIASPPEGLSWPQRTIGPVSLPEGGSLEIDITLSRATGLPPGGSLTPFYPYTGFNEYLAHLPFPDATSSDDVRVVDFRDALDLAVPGCAGGAASYTLTHATGATLAAGEMTEVSAGTHSAQIPPSYPVTGPASIMVSMDCPDGTDDSIVFDIYIDPSSMVQTLAGLPIRDAVVTLFRADSPNGPFEQVPDGSAILSPSNRANPDQTDADGRFHWDVIAGYYVVRAQRGGCVSVTGAPYVESEVLPAPAAVTDLDLRLSCPDLEDTTPPVSTASVSPAPNASGWHDGPVTVQLTAVDEGSGVQEIVYTLSGAHDGGESVAGDRATIYLTAEGITTLAWFARDRAGNEEAPHSLELRIDSTAPSLSCSASPDVLSPPNHQLVSVQVDVLLDDALSGAGSFVLASIASSEPDDGNGDGDADDDMQQWSAGTADTDGLLRAERSGGGPGRSYTLVYEAWDQADNAATCSVMVTVPRDRGH